MNNNVTLQAIIDYLKQQSLIKSQNFQVKYIKSTINDYKNSLKQIKQYYSIIEQKLILQINDLTQTKILKSTQPTQDNDSNNQKIEQMQHGIQENEQNSDFIPPINNYQDQLNKKEPKTAPTPIITAPPKKQINLITQNYQNIQKNSQLNQYQNRKQVGNSIQIPINKPFSKLKQNYNQLEASQYISINSQKNHQKINQQPNLPNVINMFQPIYKMLENNFDGKDDDDFIEEQQITIQAIFQLDLAQYQKQTVFQRLKKNESIYDGLKRIQKKYQFKIDNFDVWIQRNLLKESTIKRSVSKLDKRLFKGKQKNCLDILINQKYSGG